MANAKLARLGNIAELRDAARARLPRPIFDFMEGGAEDETSLAENMAAFERRRLVPKVGVDVAAIDPRTTILGRPVSWPVIMAPTGMTRMFHPEGERAAARAAAAADTIYTVSTMSSVSIEEIAGLTQGPKWFQVYCFKDRVLTREFLDRVRASGYEAICVTVDVQVAANRERDRRSGITIPIKLNAGSLMSFVTQPRWTLNYVTHPAPILANVAHKIAEGSVNLSTVSAYINRQFDPSVTWDDLAWLGEQWGGPFIIKGVLHPDDARKAAAIGARAVVVSNHGGRQLDGATGTLDALARMKDAVGDDLELILDGGIRRGTHVLKALALGAQACMIGRPYLYGLCAGGEAGIAKALSILKTEIVRDMALLGVRNLSGIERAMVA